jgi:DNA repair ATPase RecN
MLQKLQLKNFQAHSNSTLEFHPGINTIIGQSDSGKTAILRSLYKIIYNKPAGDSFVSHWIKDGKGKLTDISSITVTKDNKVSSRIKSKDFDGYKLNDTEYTALNRDVPEDIQSFFNVSEVNIQKQMDSPFLLSSTPGEVARFFNRIIKLDVIDDSLSLIEKKKRQCNSDIKTNKSELEDLIIKKDSYNWLDDVEKKLKKCEEIQAKIQSKTESIEKISTNILLYKENSVQREKSGSMLKLEGVLNSINELNTSINDKQSTIDSLNSSIINYNDACIEKNRDLEFLNLENRVNRTIKLKEKYMGKNTDYLEFKKEVEDYKKLCYDVDCYQENITEWKKELPDTCPMCHGTGRLK